MVTFKIYGADVFNPPIVPITRVQPEIYEDDSSWGPLDAPVYIAAGSTVRFDPDPSDRYSPANSFGMTSVAYRRRG